MLSVAVPSLGSAVSHVSPDGSIYFFFFILFFPLIQEEDLKWVEDNIPSSLADV